MNAKIEMRLPGFMTYDDFFKTAAGDYKPIRCSSAERRKLVSRLGKLHGEPRDLVEGAREDILATARVREVRQYTSGGTYVRYEVRSLNDDCSWDTPQQMLTFWDAEGELEAYTFICGSGRDARVAANLHTEHNGESGDEITYDIAHVLRFLVDMEPGDSVLVGNDECDTEFMVVSNVDGVPLVSWHVFADAWWMNSVGEVSWQEAETAVRTFWKFGIIGVQKMFAWEPADPWDENTGMRTIHVARELRRALMCSVRLRDKVLEETLRYFKVTEGTGVKTLDLAVEHGEWREMMLALDREWSRLYQVWPAEDRAKLCLYLAIEGVGGADRDIASYFYEEQDGVKNKDYDFAKAAYWEEKGAKTGDVLCQRNAGFLFRDAEEQNHNGPRAVYWFEKAAAQQDPKSMEALAECLECGKCTKQDPKRAAELRKAAALKEEDGTDV